MFQYKYLLNYLLEILTYKKHFNIVEELQQANIKKREDNLKNLLKNNPFDELTHKIRNEKPYFQNIIRCDDLKKSFFVKPKLDNPRIIKQSGTFIVCGMDDIKYFSSKEIFDIEKNKVIKRIIINKHLKDRINKSLDVFSISSGTLFPELSDVASYVKNKYGVR